MTRPAQRLVAALRAPMDAAGLAYFRVAFYGIMVWEAWRLLDNDWIEKYWSGKALYFTYWPFEFVEPASPERLKLLVIAMAAFAGLALLGLAYRTSAAAFWLIFMYLFLLEEARYLNHLYLAGLLGGLLIFLPAHRFFSLDARLRPALRTSHVPAWTVWLLRFQVGVPYFFGGVAKLNADWLRGEPLREWLSDRTDFPFLGSYFTHEPVVWAMTYSSLLLDLGAPLALLLRRTRVFAFIAILAFHVINSRLFGIGIFPWMMIATTLLFFDSAWPRRLWRDLARGPSFRGLAAGAGAVLGFLIGGLLPMSFVLMRALIGALGVAVAAYHLDEPWKQPDDEGATATTEPSSRTFPPGWGFTSVLLGLWVLVQCTVPLRHLVIRGNVHWTEEGHRFAWHMKLRDKLGRGNFIVTDPASGRTWHVDPARVLSRFQRRKMVTRPMMIVFFARRIEALMRHEGFGDVEVRAAITASLNGRDHAPLVDPTVDLTAVPYPWFGHAEWILPLEVRNSG